MLLHTDFTVYSNGKAVVHSGAIAYYNADDFVMPDLSGSDEEGEEEEETTGGAEGAAETTGSAPSAGTETETSGGAATETETTGGAATETATTTTVVDQGPAKATTAANDIVDNAPKGAMVVGAGQTSTIDNKGQASKPVVEAKKRATKVKSTVASASTKDAMNATVTSSSSTTETTPVTEVKQTASIKVNITIEKD